jgi:hypothetical protein
MNEPAAGAAGSSPQIVRIPLLDATAAAAIK